MGCRNSRIKFRGYAYVMQEQCAASAPPPSEPKITTTNIDFTPNCNNLIVNKPTNLFPPVDIVPDSASLVALAASQFNAPPVIPQPPIDLTPPSFGLYPPMNGFVDQFPNFEADYQAFASLMPQMEVFLSKMNEQVVPAPLAMPMFSPIKESLVPAPLAMPILPKSVLPPPMLPPLQIPPIQQLQPVQQLQPIQQFQPIQQLQSIPPLQQIPPLQSTKPIKQLRPISSLSNNLPSNNLNGFSNNLLQFPSIPIQNNMNNLDSLSRFNMQSTPNPFMNKPPPTPMIFSKPFFKPINVQ